MFKQINFVQCISQMLYGSIAATLVLMPFMYKNKAFLLLDATYILGLFVFLVIALLARKRGKDV